MLNVLAVNDVSAYVRVREIVSVDVPPNSAYTKRENVKTGMESVSYCGSQCLCHRWKEGHFQFVLNIENNAIICELLE